MDQEYDLFVGIDWATASHAVCVLDRDRKVIAELEVGNNGEKIAGLAKQLEQLAALDRIAVGIEVPRGAIVETLVERGAHVYALNPKQTDRFRDRHTVAGAKDDRRDAFVIADALSTDRHRFRRVRLDDPHIIELREVSRMDEELKEELNRLANRLREQLLRYFEQALSLCSSADEPWIWAVLEAAPTPAAARKLRPKKIEKILKEHRIRRVKPHEVVDVLRRRPLEVAPGTAKAASAHVLLLIPRLRLVREQIKHCQAEMERLLGELENEPDKSREQHDVRILRSSPGVGRNVAATLLAEASQPLAERDYQAIRTLAGAAPVTRQSGKQRSVIMRRACNGRLRNALYHWARTATQHDVAARARYAALRARGHSHGRALRSVADRLLRMLVAMLRTGTLYDASRSSPQSSAGDVACA
jgi:transposase